MPYHKPRLRPASFPIHDDFHPLIGAAHAAIADDCVACHNGDYNNTPNTCVGCHTQDFNNTTDSNHVAAQFSTDCTTCHTETSWVPATLITTSNIFPSTQGRTKGSGLRVWIAISTRRTMRVYVYWLSY
ncbi:MAG: cytochrome c3 family protein [Saprospiraceae bacterium]